MLKHDSYEDRHGWLDVHPLSVPGQSRLSKAAATAGSMHAHICTLSLRTSSTAMFSSHHLMGSQKGLGWGSCCRKDSSSVLRRGRGIC